MEWGPGFPWRTCRKHVPNGMPIGWPDSVARMAGEFSSSAAALRDTDPDRGFELHRGATRPSACETSWCRFSACANVHATTIPIQRAPLGEIMLHTTFEAAAQLNYLAQEGIDTGGVGTFLRQQVVPPILGVSAVVLLSKAIKSSWSSVITIAGLSVIGLGWFGLSANPDAAMNVGTSIMKLFVPGM